MVGDSDNSSSSPNKRLKTLIVTTPSTSSDCKCKIQCDLNQCEPLGNLQSETNSSSRGCSICFLEDGKSIRGEINCCDHYFCFLCIMEWAKIESRCPMCRRRFNTIRRPPKVGLFARERIVRVPVRDQVNFHFGNTTLPFDPYARVVCNVCNGMADGNLLLLCDLCDSAAHTYCVGLGVTVPEGDWFCHDCTVSKAEQHAIREIISEDGNRNEVPPAIQNDSTVGIVTIAQASPYPVVERPPTNSYMPPAVLGRVDSSAVEITGPVVRTLIIPTKSSESGARTLDRCRNVHSHIQSLRENWNALRMGSLSFSSSSFKPGSSSEKRNMHESSVQAISLSSASCQLSQSQGGCGSLDIDKAWKMLDIAKSKLRAPEKTRSVQPSKLHPSKASPSKERSNMKSIDLVKCQRFGSRDLERSGKEKHVKSDCVEKRKYSNMQKERHIRVPNKDEAGCSQSFLSSSSPGLFESSRSRNVGNRTNNIFREKRSILLRENTDEVLLYAMNEKNGSTCSGRQGTSEFLDAYLDPTTSSTDKIDTSKFNNIVLENDFVESKERKDDGAKREIQSLVKLNLKLLSRDKHLGTDAFKKIARLATHTILAACGLAHRKSDVYSFPSVICPHNEHSKQLPKSNLMPKSCRQCFYVFVKDVVNSIMFDKVGSTNVTV